MKDKLFDAIVDAKTAVANSVCIAESKIDDDELCTRIRALAAEANFLLAEMQRTIWPGLGKDKANE